MCRAKNLVRKVLAKFFSLWFYLIKLKKLYIHNFSNIQFFTLYKLVSNVRNDKDTIVSWHRFQNNQDSSQGKVFYFLANLHSKIINQ